MHDPARQFQWSERYSVGVQQFDADHRHLLALAHELVNARLNGPLPTPPGDVLGDLIACAQEHFAHEERLLAATGYPHLEHHRREHRRLLTEIEAYQADFSAGRVAAEDVARFVADWIFVHMTEEDQHYREHLNGRGYR